MTKKPRRNSKWHKHQFAIKNEELAPYLPETKRYNKSVLWNMLERHQAVIVKPSLGTKGKGILKVESSGEGLYSVSWDHSKQDFHHKTELEGFLAENIKKNKLYLIQQYIQLADIDGKLMDIRYLIQRIAGEKDWEITFKYAKVAKPGSLTTNVAGGAQRSLIQEALEQSSVCDLNIQAIQDEMDRVALVYSDILLKQFQKQTIWGLDLAVDKNGQIWIIEANPFPAIKKIAKFNPEMYKRVVYYLLKNRKKKF